MNMFSNGTATVSLRELSITNDITLEEIENPDELLRQHGSENDYLNDSDLSGAFQNVKDKYEKISEEKGVKKC